MQSSFVFLRLRLVVGASVFFLFLLNTNGWLGVVQAGMPTIRNTPSLRTPTSPYIPSFKPSLAPDIKQLPLRPTYEPLSIHEHEVDPAKTLSLIGSDEDPFLQLAQAAGQPAVPTESAPQKLSMEEIANKINNPVADLWLLWLQNDTFLLEGDATAKTRVFNSLSFRPLISVPIGEFFGRKWLLANRPVIQFNSVPVDDDVGKLFGVNAGEIFSDDDLRSVARKPFGRTTGFGDFVFFSLLAPDGGDEGIIWGVGPTFIFPTASKDVLGQGKYQAGPAALIAYMGKKWNLGLLPQQWWSFAGDDDRKSTSQMDIQYFIQYKLRNFWQIGMAPNIRINWKTDDVTFPIGFGANKLVFFGPLPVRIAFEAQYYVTRPDALGSDWNFRVAIIPAIPNLLK